MDRRSHRSLVLPMLLLLFAWHPGTPLAAQNRGNAQHPNILLLLMDDQNDWVGPLAGHAHAVTPHLDRLAARGTVFANAHSQATLCNPSRTSLLLGLRPSTTGIYGLDPSFRDVAELKQRRTMLQAFHQAGYRTLVAGKVFHHDPTRRRDGLALEADIFGPPAGAFPQPPRKLIPPTPEGDHPLMDWGSFPHRDHGKSDYQLASWIIDQLASGPRDRPFFLAAGFFLPHVPCHVPEPWLARIPDSDLVLPRVLRGDREDTPPFSWYLHWKLPEPRLEWLEAHKQWRNLVRSYLASTAFVDAQIGRVLAGLEACGLAEDTVIVVCSDHGWHLGEKGITGKNSLWERSTRVPLVLAGPGIATGARCGEPVELLDIYPTLLELAALPRPNDLEGHSLRPQLDNPAAPRAWPAITTSNQGNHSVRTRDWRLIRYADGSEELYDHRVDPREEWNLATDPRQAAQRAALRAHLPTINQAPVAGSAHRVLTYDAATGQAVWEGEPIEQRP
jgi:choline-sulfatase